MKAPNDGTCCGRMGDPACDGCPYRARTTNHETKARAIKWLRAAADQIEREGLKLVDLPEWVGVTLDDQHRIVHLRVNMRFES